MKLLSNILWLAMVTTAITAQDYKILVLPCGGAGSVIPARLLQHLEEQTKQPTHRLFKEIWSASSGAAIAALLTKQEPASAKEVVKFFEDRFSRLYKAYSLREALRERLGNEKIKDTKTLLRVLTAACSNHSGPWHLYDFSSDGIGSCKDTQIKLADIVAASCTVYPYLYRNPVKLKAQSSITYAIDPGSLCVEDGTSDPTAYFLAQRLSTLADNNTLTIYFMGNAFTQSPDYRSIIEVLNAQGKAYTIRTEENVEDQMPRASIELVVIPVTTECSEIIDRYAKKSNIASRVLLNTSRFILNKVVGEENAEANLVVCGMIPTTELKKEAHNIIKHSKNFQLMVQAFKNYQAS